MSKLTATQKAERVLTLLLGLRNSALSKRMSEAGFSLEDLEDGWSLLRRLARVRLDSFGALEMCEPSVLADLTRWQNRWFPVVEVSLTRHHPELAQRLLPGLVQCEGPAVVMSVRRLLECLQRLMNEPGEESDRAVTRLMNRGLTPKVIDQATSLLFALPSPEPNASLSSLDSEPPTSAAEHELWEWYLKWCQVARHAIVEPNQLRSLGISPESPQHLEEGEDSTFEIVTTTSMR